MKLFAYPNNRAKDVDASLDPLTFTPNVPEKARASKKAYVAFISSPSTQHCLYSVIEGTLTGMKPTKKDAALVHGFVCDWDDAAKIESDADIAKLLKQLPAHLHPRYIHKSYSGAPRAIWDFAAPVPYHNAAFFNAFTRALGKELRVSTAWRGKVDYGGKAGGGMADPSTVWDVGDGLFREVSQARVPVSTLDRICFQIGSNPALLQNGRKLPELPIEVIQQGIAAAVKDRGWSPWAGEWRFGAHGNFFWDDAEASKGGRAVVIHPAGVQEYHTQRGFIPWGDPSLLGPEFVKDYEGDRISQAIRDIHYDGKTYWWKPNVQWESDSKEPLATHLRVSGIDATRGKKETASEMDRAFHMIHTQRRVLLAAPFLYEPSGVGWKGGEPVLNISRVRPPSLADSGSEEWGEDFPWIAALLDGMLVKKQKHYMLAWMHRLVSGAVAGRLLKGHALILCGDPGSGKTFISECLLPTLMGMREGTDATAVLLHGSQFNDHLFESPIWSVDDPPPATDKRRKGSLEYLLKQMASNSVFSYEAKFKKAGMIEFNGRVVLTMNADPHSIQSMPEFQASTQDKFLMLRCRHGKHDWKHTHAQNKRVVASEAPFFLRWLLENWVRPKYVKENRRFGFDAMQDKDLRKLSEDMSPPQRLVELIQTWLRGAGDARPGSFVGTPTDLHREFAKIEDLRESARVWQPERIQQNFGILRTREWADLERTHTESGNYWSFTADAALSDAAPPPKPRQLLPKDPF